MPSIAYAVKGISWIFGNGVTRIKHDGRQIGAKRILILAAIGDALEL
jgi:hypothetical protein